MKKLVLTLSIVLAGFTYEASAQASNIGVNLSTALPLGNLANATNFGIGGGLSYDYYFNDHFDLGIEGEFIAFPYDLQNASGSSNLIPVLVTGGYHTDYGNEVDFYGELGAGMYFSSFTIDYEDENIQDQTGNSADFGISPRIGIALEMGNRLFFDASIRYGLIFDTAETSYLGLNLGILYTITE
jgi:outer membrane protein W